MGVGVRKTLQFPDGSTFRVTLNTQSIDVRALATAGKVLTENDSGPVKIKSTNKATGVVTHWTGAWVNGEHWQATDKQRGRRLLINASSAAIEYDHPRPPKRLSLHGALALIQELNDHNLANGLPAVEVPGGVVNLAKHEQAMPVVHRPAADANGYPGIRGDAGERLWVSPRGECWLQQAVTCRRVARAIAVRWLASNDYQTIPAALVAPPAVRGVVGDKEDGK